MTELEEYFRGEGGDQYTLRNDNELSIRNYINLYSNVLASTDKIGSIVDFGANVGYGLKALRILLPEASLSGVEINEEACRILKERMGDVTVYNESVISGRLFKNTKADLVTVTALLMYIEDGYLQDVYKTLYVTSNRYIFIGEYYNPIPTKIDWRGTVLYKRDFAGDMLDMFPTLQLLNYGFIYHRDNHFPLDDVNWFLLEKKV